MGGVVHAGCGVFCVPQVKQACMVPFRNNTDDDCRPPCGGVVYCMPLMFDECAIDGELMVDFHLIETMRMMP